MSKIIEFPAARTSRPSGAHGAVPRRPPARARAAERRALTEAEHDALSAAAMRAGAHGHRDKTLIIVAYRYGLRVSELVSLRWDMLDLRTGVMHDARLERGAASAQQLRGLELRALRQLGRERVGCRYVFVCERQQPLTTAAVHKIVAHAGEAAGFPFRVEPHMLRRSAASELSMRPASSPWTRGSA